MISDHLSPNGCKFNIFSLLITIDIIENIVSKRRKCRLLTIILSFSHNVFYPMKDKSNVLSNINFVICKFSTLEKVKIFSSSKGLTVSDYGEKHFEKIVKRGENESSQHFHQAYFPNYYLSFNKLTPIICDINWKNPQTTLKTCTNELPLFDREENTVEKRRKYWLPWRFS